MPFLYGTLSAETLEFEIFVLEFVFWLKEKAPELSWLTSSQFEVGGVAMPRIESMIQCKIYSYMQKLYELILFI